MQREKQIILLGVFFTLLASYFSAGFFYPDEHFQILEFAGMKLGLTTAAKLPWEYHAQMRPALQPLMVYCIYKVFAVFGTPNPFSFTFFLRFISGIVSFFAYWLVYKKYRHRIHGNFFSVLFTLTTFLSWFAIYHGVRFSSETWSAAFFIFGFILYDRMETKEEEGLIKTFLLPGILFGFSFLFRYQSGFLIAGFMLWLLVIKRENIFDLFFMGFGIIAVMLLGVLIDKWYYGNWTLTTWNYFDQNIIHKKAEKFGTSPWWIYIKDFFIKAGPPYSLLFIFALPVYFILKPKSSVTWSIIPFFAVHLIISHKELRFLIPALPFLPYMMVYTFSEISSRLNISLENNILFKALIYVSLGVNFILVPYVSLLPAYEKLPFYKKLYNEFKTPTILYYFRESAYMSVGLHYDFYKSKNMEEIEIKQINDINCKDNRVKLVISTEEWEDTNRIKLKEIYKTLPDWILKYNFNNWADRTVIWHIYKIEECKIK